MRRSSGVVFALLVLVPSPSLGEGISFVVETAESRTATGPLASLGPGWSARVGDVSVGGGAGDELVSLRRAGLPLPPFPVGPQVLLADGDRVPGTVVGLKGERLRFRAGLDPGREMDLPLSAVLVIWAGAPEGVREPDRLPRRLLAERRRRDVVLLRNGDTVEGVLAGLDNVTKHAVTVEVDGREAVLDFSRVAAVALNTALAGGRAPRRVVGRLVLADGGRLTLAEAAAEGDVLVGKTLFGAAVRVPLQEVRALDVRGGRVAYLSDLKPRSYEYLPYLAERWDYVADGSVAGGDLLLGGGAYDKGVGVHGACRLSYELRGGYRRFEAVVGMDDRAGGEGRARVRVLVDGRERPLGWDGRLSGRGLPRAVRVDVTGGRVLTLEVGADGRGNVQGHVDWGDARLVR